MGKITLTPIDSGSPILTLQETKQWLNLEPEEKQDDRFLEDQLIPMSTNLLLDQFGLHAGVNEVQEEFHLSYPPTPYSNAAAGTYSPVSGDPPYTHIFPSKYPVAGDSSVTVEYYDCEAETPIWSPVNPDSYEVVLNSPEYPRQYLRSLSTLCDPCQRGFFGCPMGCSPRLFRVTYISGTPCSRQITDIQRLWLRQVVASLYKNRESEMDYRIVDSPVFKRLTMLSRSFDYPG